MRLSVNLFASEIESMRVYSTVLPISITNNPMKFVHTSRFSTDASSSFIISGSSFHFRTRGFIGAPQIRVMLTIWGVLLFVRLPWIVGQAGALLASLVVLASAAVTFITTLSMSAIASNGELRSGTFCVALYFNAPPFNPIR